MKYNNRIIKGIAVVLLITVLLALIFTACSKKVDREASEDISETYGLTHGKSLKIGDYVQLGNYQVENEDYNPILWIVIDNSSHYSGYVNPEVEHITLLSACIIDIRGFDAIESENTNELRRGYGNGRYRTSNIRQWLNSSGDENNWWATQDLDDGETDTNNVDEPPSDDGFPDFEDIGYDDKEGFLKSFNADEFNAMLETTLVVGKNAVTDGGGSEEVQDRVFLLSLAEIGFGDRSEVEEGRVFELFSSDSSRQAEVSIQCIVNTNCSDKPLDGENWPWWLRSPAPGFTASVFIVSDIGAALYSTANMCEGSVGIRPALNIKTSLYFSGSGTNDDPYIITDAVMDGTVEAGLLEENTTEKSAEDIDKSPESGEIKVTIAEDTTLSDGDKLLQTICLEAIDDYPKWTGDSRSIVVWKDSKKNDKNLSIRRSPESSTLGLQSRLQSPAENLDILTILDFVSADTIGYAMDVKGGGGAVGLLRFGLDELGAKLSYSHSSVIYEKEEPISIRDISFINRDEFLMFYISESQVGQEKAIVSYINVKNKKEKVLLELNIISFDGENKTYNVQKVSASPKGTYAYIVYNSTSKKQGEMAIFDLSSRKLIDEISPVSSAVWIGNTHILYSSLAGGGEVFIYDVEDKKSYKMTRINRYAVDLAFCPKSGGVIVYNTDPFSNEARGYAVSCKDWKELDQVANCIFETIADEDTVIFSKYVPGGSGESSDIIVKEGGYRRLKSKWALHLSDEFSTNYQNTVLATVWSRY